jgi:predicted porin
MAQSTVTVFGTLDLNATATRAGGRTVKAIDQGGNIFPSRLGFRGTEDMGGGLSAGFWLEAALLPDTGEVQGGMWNRRSTLSLASKSLGELRLGRDYMPTFWNMSQYGPFGTVGVAGSSNIIEGWPFGLGGARTQVRTNNSIGYFLPGGLGGVYGQATVAAAEGQGGAHYTGARLGYAAGPVDVAIAHGQTPLGSARYKISNIGGSYDFGAIRLMGFYSDQRAGADRQKSTLIGASLKVGDAGYLRASIANSDRSGPGVDADDARQLAIGYLHYLSKRTALYATYSQIRNRGNAAYVTSDSSPAADPGGNASGLQAGISHQF